MPNFPFRPPVLNFSPYYKAAFARRAPIPNEFAHCRKSPDQSAGLCERRLGARSARSPILRGMSVLRNNSVVARPFWLPKSGPSAFSAVCDQARAGMGWITDLRLSSNVTLSDSADCACITASRRGICDAWSHVVVGVWCAQLTCGVRRGAGHRPESASVQWE